MSICEYEPIKMKKYVFLLIIGLIIFASFSPFRFMFDHPLDPGTKIAHKICREIAHKFKEEHQLKWVGIAEAGPEKYTWIGLKFSYPKILSKDEGRELILKCANDALNIFNSHPEFEEHMNNVPFTYDNISISIFIHPPGNFNVYYPDFDCFKCISGDLVYKTDAPGHKGLYFTEEIETIDEAKQIIQEKAQGK